jgi:hypothetical protein
LPIPVQAQSQSRARKGKSLEEILRDVRAAVIDEMERAEAGPGLLRYESEGKRSVSRSGEFWGLKGQAVGVRG